MFTLRSTWQSHRAKGIGGVVALAVSGLVAGLALTGQAAAEGDDDYAGGWPTELFGKQSAATTRFDRASDRVVTFRSREVRATDIDSPGDGQFGPGSYFVFEERLFRGGEQVGRDSVRCMLNHRSIMCDGTLVTGGGNIELAGTQFFGDGGFQLAVTGGTGRYRDAAGILTPRGGGPGPGTRLVIRLID